MARNNEQRLQRNVKRVRVARILENAKAREMDFEIKPLFQSRGNRQGNIPVQVVYKEAEGEFSSTDLIIVKSLRHVRHGHKSRGGKIEARFSVSRAEGVNIENIVQVLKEKIGKSYKFNYITVYAPALPGDPTGSRRKIFKINLPSDLDGDTTGGRK